MSYIHVSDDDVAATSGCDIAATIEENTIRIVDKSGEHAPFAATMADLAQLAERNRISPVVFDGIQKD